MQKQQCITLNWDFNSDRVAMLEFFQLVFSGFSFWDITVLSMLIFLGDSEKLAWLHAGNVLFQFSCFD